jgi:UDP-glucose 4,6-dehydratase
MRYDRLLDVENSLANLNEFVDACLHCLDTAAPYGVYNVVNSGSITTRDVVALIRKHLGGDRRYDFFSDQAEFLRETSGVPRSSCVLDNSKLLETGFPISGVHDAISRALSNWKGAIGAESSSAAG